MASGAVHDAVKDYLTGAWATTQIAWENEDFLPPNPPVAWIDVQMSGTNYGQQTIGAANPVSGNRWDEEGLLFIDVLVPSGTGASIGRTYAKQIADLFRGVTLLSGNLEFMDAFIGSGRPSERDGNWWGIAVAIEWRRVEA